MDKRRGLSNLFDRERRPPRIAAGALDFHEANGRIAFQRLPDGFKIELTVRKHVDLAVFHAVIGQRAASRLAGQADDLFQRVIGLAAGGQQRIAGAQHAVQAQRQRVGAGGDLRAHNCVLAAQQLGEYRGERVAANVVVAIACGRRKMARRNAVLLESGQHAARVMALNAIQTSKALGAVALSRVHQSFNFRINGCHFQYLPS